MTTMHHVTMLLSTIRQTAATRAEASSSQDQKAVAVTINPASAL